ncbi:hypothetical protein AHiyo6_18800 [Arthrobacter sp. Hiyo6]|nr:hypothetical protein AHiyo6_18800 [Arthrobacter sp. Hiyo6]
MRILVIDGHPDAGSYCDAWHVPMWKVPALPVTRLSSCGCGR